MNATSFNPVQFISQATENIATSTRYEPVKAVATRLAKSLAADPALAAQLRAHAQTIFQLRQNMGNTDIHTIRIPREESPIEQAKRDLELLVNHGSEQLKENMSKHLEAAAKDATANSEVSKDRANLTEEARETPPKQDITIENCKITGIANGALIEASMAVIGTLTDSNTEALLKGSMKLQDITAAFGTETAIPTNESKNSAEIATELNQFAAKIIGKNLEQTKEIFAKELSIHAQQVLSLIADKHLTYIFDKDVIHVCAAAIKADTGLSHVINQKTLENYKTAAETREKVVNDVNEIARRAKLSAQLGDLINNYKVGMKQAQELGDPAAKAKWQNQITLKFQNGFDALMNKGVFKDDITRLQKHLELADAKGGAEACANDIQGFAKKLMGKLFSKNGAALAMFALPIISKIVPHLWIIGPYLSGITSTLSQGVMTLTQMYNASSQMFGGIQEGATSNAST